MTDIAIFGGGCFWCLEPVFKRLKGIVSVETGYAGGHFKEPSYEAVCTGNTGHAEVVKIEFEPKIISYETLLEVFFSMHDPTTPNRQGADIGTQYRSIILFKDKDQMETAQRFIDNLRKEKIFNRDIVTEIKKFEDYYPAEDYHQDYYDNNSFMPYCQFLISPKLKKLQGKYKDLLK